MVESGHMLTPPPPPHVDQFSKLILVHGTYTVQTFAVRNQGVSVLSGKSTVFQSQPMNSSYIWCNLVLYTKRVENNRTEEIENIIKEKIYGAYGFVSATYKVLGYLIYIHSMLLLQIPRG